MSSPAPDDPPLCPLCKQPSLTSYFTDAAFRDSQGRVGPRTYLRCAVCDLVSVAAGHRPSPADERRVYDLHENHPDDAGYQRFLNQLIDPLCARLGAAPRTILDFGCGPGPALAAMLRWRGHQVHIYDPIYAPNPAVLDRQFAVITCTEALEHFFRPHREWNLWMSLLEPDGWLGVMTQLRPDDANFPHWHYRRDPTHVSLFSARSVAWLAMVNNLTLEILGTRVVLMQRRRTRP